VRRAAALKVTATLHAAVKAGEKVHVLVLALSHSVVLRGTNALRDAVHQVVEPSIRRELQFCLCAHAAVGTPHAVLNIHLVSKDRLALLCTFLAVTKTHTVRGTFLIAGLIWEDFKLQHRHAAARLPA
jgi:hypothetical protein